MKTMKKLMALGLSVAVIIGALSGCGSSQTADNNAAAAVEQPAEQGNGDAGISSDSPYAGLGFDLSENKTVVMYAIGDRPTDMDEVLEKLNNEYLTPWLNTQLEVQFLNWSDYETKYSLVLAGGETVDLMFSSAWCYYPEESAKGAFIELTPEWLQENLPYSYEQHPAQSWEQVSIGGKIYGIPRTNAVFDRYCIVAVRSDMMDKYGYESLDSWDDYTSFLKDVAADTKETGISATAMTPVRLETQDIWQIQAGMDSVVAGDDWFYYHNNSEKAPMADDIFYLYTSDAYLEYALESAELAAAGCWSSNAINDTNDPRYSFSNGTSAAYSFNGTVFQVGRELESAGLGTYEAYDIAPNMKRSRGTYAGDIMTIATNSKDPVRAALVLDALKAFPEVNNLIMGGIEGKHYELNENGERITLEASAGYPWAAWSWALQTATMPTDASIDPREKEFDAYCAANEFAPEHTGFTFDKSNVEAEMNIIDAIRNEYRPSFCLGIYGENTKEKFEEFKSKVEAAGLDKVTEEYRRQYKEYCQQRGLTVE